MAENDQVKIDILVDDKQAEAALNRFHEKVIAKDKELANRPPIALLPAIGGTSSMGRNGRDLELSPKIKQIREANDALKLTSHQMGSLSYQLNDIVTMTAMGASPFQIMASQGGQIVQVFGSVNQALAATQAGLAKVGISLAGLGVMGGVAAVGYGVIRWSKSVREEAERRLKVEEQINGAINRQIILGQQILANYQKRSDLQEKDQDFTRFLKEGSTDDLQRRLANLRTLVNLGGGSEMVKNKDGKWESVQTEESKRRVDDILKLEAQIRDRTGLSQMASDFNSRYDDWKKSQENRIAQMKAWAENVEKAKARVNELTVAHKALFEGLTVQAYSDNPFVKIAVEGDRAFRELKENIRGLPEEMQNAAMASQRAFNAKQLFGAMVDNAMGVFDLRELARTLGDDSASRKAMANSAYSSDWQEYQRRLSLGTVMNEEANREYFERRRQFIDGNFNGESASDRLERQIDALKRLSPSNADEQAIIDQRIIGLVRSIDPSQLSANQRSEGINAALREAERQERYRQQSLEVARQTLETNRSIDENQKRLLAVAEKGGVAGIDNALKIQIQDETGRATVESRGSANDVAVRYGSYSGGGGLTSY